MNIDQLEAALAAQDISADLRVRILALCDTAHAETWTDTKVPTEVPRSSKAMRPPSGLSSPSLVGRGGMAEVYRVRDNELDRDVALKVIRPEIGTDPRALRRFVTEARITARLQHPGIVPVHDLGFTAAGRRCFTMKLVEGRTLFEVLQEQPPLRRLMDLFRSVCEPLAYAHSEGIVHRDLKPDNVMIGAWGEVLVLDWGVAKELSVLPISASGEMSADPTATQYGEIAGTPIYMAPEQARGDLDDVGPWTDVYALGLLLFEMLVGHRAHNGPHLQVLFRVARGIAPELPEGLDPELSAICRRCLEAKSADRYASAEPLMRAVTAWLDGEKRRERAMSEVARADELAAQTQALRERATALGDRVRVLQADDVALDQIWTAEDEVDALALQITEHQAKWRQILHAALIHEPGLAEAHRRLAEDARGAAERAEQKGDTLEEARCEADVRQHNRGEHTRWLRSTGQLRLQTDPPVGGKLYRVEEHTRTRRPVFQEDLPVDVDLELPRGSWHLELDGAHGPVVFPVRVRRDQLFENRHPDGLLRPVRTDIRFDRTTSCRVPAGWYQTGGDPLVSMPQPARQVWVEDFVIRRFPVTQGEFLRFLNDQVQSGNADVAQEHAPRDGGSTLTAGASIYPRLDDGRYTLPEATEAQTWHPDLPIFLVSHAAALAYAAWLSARTEQAWRLPSAHEREKAARGVDGRLFPWGDTWDPRRTNSRMRSKTGVSPLVVDSMPADCSVYGVRGVCGNVSDWLSDYTWRTGPGVTAEGLSAPILFDSDHHRYATFAGGAWNAGQRYSRLANFGHYGANVRVSALGIRLARSV